MFRGNLAHTGVFGTTGPRSLAVTWRFATNGFVISSPAVVGRTVYVGSADGRLYAIDRDSGTKRWAFQTHLRISSSPAVSDGLVYVLSYDDTLYAVDAATGQAKWRFGTQGEHRYTATYLHGGLPKHEARPDPYDLYLSSPAVSNGIVYFGSGDSHVYALDAATGAVKWKFKTGDDQVFHNQIGIASSPAIVDGVVYFGCRDSHIYAVDAKTGKEKWNRPNRGAWVISSPAVASGKVYYATADQRTFVELNAATGDSVWATRGSWYFFGSPAIAGSMAYIGNWDGRFYAFDMATHTQTSMFETDSARSQRAKYLAPDGGYIFATSPLNREAFYDQLVVRIMNSLTMGGYLSSPVVSDGVVYVGSMDGNVYALGESRSSERTPKR